MSGILGVGSRSGVIGKTELDYETGTWTPTVEFGGGTTSITYSHNLGRYTKIGNIVTADLQIIMTSKGSSTGAATITTLPFTVNGNDFSGIEIGLVYNMSAVPNDGYVTGTTFYLYNRTTTNTATDNDDFADNTRIAIRVTYGI